MKISELLATGQPTLSFEVFPPRSDSSLESIKAATAAIAELGPDFMSVTYGANGGARTYSAEIARHVQEHGAVAMAHFTCVGATKESVREQLSQLRAGGIENVLALRGDLPEGVSDTSGWAFRHASDMAEEIKKNGDFCIGGACYPEKHPDARTIEDDIVYMKLKQDAGCEFLTTQMFFDNEIFYRYMYKLRNAGVTVPIIPGIMPISNAKQMERILKLSEAFIPRRYVSILERYGDRPEALKQASITYTTDQIIDLLANGVNNIHIYTMNKPDVAAKLQENLSELIPSCRRAVDARRDHQI